MAAEKTKKTMRTAMLLPPERIYIVVELACLYLQEKSYPADCTASKKRHIRQRAKKFSIVDRELFYKPSADGKVNLQLLCMHEEAIAVLLPYTILVYTVAGEVYPGQK